MQHSDLLSIKEFSDFTGVNQSTLRYYDKIGLFSPSARGENNYRYYTPQQSMSLNFINVLSDLGIPLSTIKEINGGRTPERVLELLAQQEYKLDRQLYELNTAYSIIHTFRNNIQRGLLSEGGEISVQKLDETQIIFGRANDFSNTQTFYKPFMEFCHSAYQYGINLRYPIGGYHETWDSFQKAPGQPEKFFSLDPHGKDVRPAGQYLVCYKRCYYGDFGDFPQRIAEYAEAHNLLFTGSLYIVYPLDEVCIGDHSQYLAQIAVGVSEDKKRGKALKIYTPGPY